MCDNGRCELMTGPPSWVPIGTAPTGSNTPPTPRADLVLELGSDGNLYAISGLQPDGTVTDTVERLDQNLNWSATSNLNNKRSLAASVSDSTSIYVLYGGKDSGFEDTVERMNTPTSWNTQSGLSYNISGAGAAFGSDGRIYVAGGSDGNAPQKSLRAFSPGDSNLTSLADLNIARERLAVANGADGRIFAIGGHGAGSTLASVEAYGIAGNAWTTVSPLPEARASTRAVLAPDGRIYLPGGADLESGIVFSSVVAYRAGAAPLADRWGHVAPLAGARYRHGVAVGGDGRIYVVGGSDLLGFVRTVEAYGPLIASNPDHQKAGQTITVTGSNFAANATVSFSLDSAHAATIGTGATDATGALVATIVSVPAGAAAGATRLYAADQRSRYPVSIAFNVDP
jgi:hypothetical protein